MNWVTKVIQVKAGVAQQVRIDHPTNPIFIRASNGTLTVNHSVEGITLTAPGSIADAGGFWYSPAAGKGFGNALQVSSDADATIIILKST